VIGAPWSAGATHETLSVDPVIVAKGAAGAIGDPVTVSERKSSRAEVPFAFVVLTLKT
jgi:hypothetical protein